MSTFSILVAHCELETGVTIGRFKGSYDDGKTHVEWAAHERLELLIVYSNELVDLTDGEGDEGTVGEDDFL